MGKNRGRTWGWDLGGSLCREPEAGDRTAMGDHGVSLALASLLMFAVSGSRSSASSHFPDPCECTRPLPELRPPGSLGGAATSTPASHARGTLERGGVVLSASRGIAPKQGAGPFIS